MDNPLISVIVPTYNYGHLITETLESISAQSYSNWECIIVDDGSTDDTAKVVRNYIKQHPEQNFQYVYQSNSGLFASRNAGIKKARGLYIQFLDADDLLSKDKFAIQLPLLQKQGAALVFSRSAFFKEQGGRYVSVEKYPPGFLAKETLSGFNLLNRLIRNNIFPVSSPLVCAALVKKAGGFDFSLDSNEDWLFWFNIALLNPQFIFDQVESSFTKIRVHPKSMMNNHRRMFLSEVAVRKKMEAQLLGQPDGHGVGQLRKKNADLLALHHVRSLELLTGMQYILKHFIRHPLQNFHLLRKGCFKMMVRLYKKMRQT